MRLKRNPLAVAGLTVCLAGFCGPAIARSSPYPVDRIPMRVEIDVGAQRYFVGENFPITVRIANPNRYNVYLGGFEFGALEPHTEVLFPGEEEFHDFSHGGTIDVIGGPPVLIPARGHIEHRRLVYSDTRLDGGHWVLMTDGAYRMRMKPSVGAVTRDEPIRYTKVDWTSDVVEFTLTMPTGRDVVALDFLRDQASELSERQRDPEGGFSSVGFQLDMYPQFLERFGDTVYAPELRWRIAKLLLSELGSNRIPEKDVPEMVDLFEECLTFCVEKGGAYAEQFLWWDLDKGGNHSVNLAIKHRRIELLGRIVAALDKRYPEDEAARLFRHARVAGYKESGRAARRILEGLIEKHPQSRYAEAAKKQIENIDRGSWPPKAPDEETVLYEAAGKAVYRSPEEGRNMLQSLLERFPNGRYARQIRLLIEAIDEGSWPPKLPQAPNAADP